MLCSKMNTNLYPVEAHSLQGRHHNNFTKLSFKRSDCISHNNQSQLTQACDFISNTSAAMFLPLVFAYVAEIFATMFSSVHQWPPPNPKGNPTCL